MGVNSDFGGFWLGGEGGKGEGSRGHASLVVMGVKSDIVRREVVKVRSGSRVWRLGLRHFAAVEEILWTDRRNMRCVVGGGVGYGGTSKLDFVNPKVPTMKLITSECVASLMP